jgi:hypothetical protein
MAEGRVVEDAGSVAEQRVEDKDFIPSKTTVNLEGFAIMFSFCSHYKAPIAALQKCHFVVTLHELRMGRHQGRDQPAQARHRLS